MDDPNLLQHYVRERSETAFATIVGRYLPLVHAAALRRLGGDDQRAREVTQMVFTELAQKAAKLVNHPALAAWLHQSTRWHAANLRRSERRRAQHEQAAAQHLVTLGSADPAPDWDALRPVLDAALDALREHDREAVLLRFFLDRPFAAIGQNLGVSENAARMRVERALDALRSILSRHGITSTTAALALALTQHVGAAAPTTLSTDAIASTACQAAAGAAAASASGALVMKTLLGLSAGAAAVFSVALWHQSAVNKSLSHELEAIPARVSSTPELQSVASPSTPGAPPIDDSALREIENELLAAAELAVPLSPEQQERVRLDTIIRKGELDGSYATLFRQLRLQPQQLDRFKTLLVERNQAAYDAMQLAKEEGLTFATLGEADEVVNAAVAEIDGRIAATIGSSTLAALHDYEELSSYRFLAASILKVEDPFDLAQDDALQALARQLKEAAPGYAELQYQANGWPAEMPRAIVDVISQLLGESEAKSIADVHAQRPARLELATFLRDAVLDGRLPISRISGSVAREYQAALAQKVTTTTP